MKKIKNTETEHGVSSGLFITLEGGEGTGKSTQIKLLHEYLTHRGIDVIITREPGGTDEAEKIRNLLVQRDGGDWDVLSEALLLFAARREHLQKLILPTLKKGTWVISDRFVDSSYVFQGYGMGLDIKIIEGLYKMIAGDFEPDLTFIFDMPPEIGLDRSTKQLSMTDIAMESTEDRYERMGLGFHQKLRQGFLDIAEKYKHRCVLVDAMQDIPTVQADLMAHIEAKFFDALNKGAAHVG